MEIDGVWVPPIPAKPVPARSWLHPVHKIGGLHNCKPALTYVEGTGNENLNEAFPCIGCFGTLAYLERNGVTEMYELTGIPDEHEVALGVVGKDPKSTANVNYDTSYVQEEAVKVHPSECDGKKAHSVQNAQVGIGSVPSPSETKYSRKRSNDGIDMNKKPSQRHRTKKHRPKVLDDSKPRKVPKAQTPRASTPRPKTPKPVTPNRIQERRKYTRKNKFTGSTSSMQSSTSDAPEDVQDDQAASRASIIAVRSCKRSLDFDFQLVGRDSHHVSKSHEQPPSFNFDLGAFDYFSKIVTSKRNTPRKSRFQKKSIKASGDLLRDNNKQQCGEDIFIIKNQEEAEKHVRKFVYSYQRRKKSSSSAATYIPTLQVYHRTFKENQCLQNSKKSGPNFPRMFKKRRAMRKKATTFGNWWYIKAVKDGKSYVKRSRGKLKQTTRKRVHNSVNKSKDSKGVLKSNLHINKRFLHVFSPMKEQTSAAISNLESFKCVLSLSPIAQSKKKRSKWLPRRRENMMDLSIVKAMPYDNEKCLLQQEENFLQITEFLPLQEVPVLRIKSFTSQHRDFQRGNNFVDTLKWPQLQEVPVLESRSLLPRHQDMSLTKKYLNNLYVREMTEYLIGKIENLDINGPCKELVVRDHNVSGALVKIDPPRKRKVLPKVKLDEETLRVWKLLMENDGSESVEEMDKDKEEWWERQRKVFCGRVDSFIAKMHLIQGNRRFSPWKGSVVDSVVGVYLTQNVSDHLSSSAFMSLAARFPVRSRSKEVDDHGEVAASQESVGSNTKVDGGFSNNNEREQDMSNSCADMSDETPITERKQETVSNEFPIQDKPCVNGNSSTFRELLDIEEVDYLKQFQSYGDDESPPNESRVNGDLCVRKGEAEEQSGLSFDLPGSLELRATTSDVNVGLCETSGVVRNTEREVVGENGGSSRYLKHSESEFIVQQKATPEEEPRIVDRVCSLQPEVTIKERVDAVNNHHSMKAKPLDRETATGKKKSRIEEKQETKTDWEKLRKTYCKSGGKETNGNNMDAVDWDAVRRATVEEIAETIVERGMNNVLAARIKEFLERMVKDHGIIDLEWLRDVPPDKAKEFLLSIQGIGLKSVECVRLLTLHHLAFPVDTNVGRVATRLGWVPLQPLPEEIQIHLLNSYPMVDTIQKYLFPRLCTLDQRTLYELHYQLITFGKVFCTKINPNCNACPMRAECRHYASAFASARLALPGSKESSVTSVVPAASGQNHSMLGIPPASSQLELNNSASSYHAQNCEPIIEVPPSPEPEVKETLPIGDIEDYSCESDDEIPTIRLNTGEFRETLKDTIDASNISLPEPDMSKALVALTAEAASIHVPRMKFVAKLRTVHLVYELPDSHPSLAGFDKREQDDPSPYLLAIWLPGETSKSSEYTENGTCTSSNNNQEETVRGTILIPCRTANRGKFPLNGTYFQVNEVFADDETSQNPMDVPRRLLWNLTRRSLGCGTSATSIFKGLSTDDIQRCFWKGSICVRGFNRGTRQPRPLHRRFHISTTAVAAENKKVGKRWD